MKSDITKADRWLVFPRPNPQASLRLFCLSFAGGGPQTFTAWPDGLANSVEVCSIHLPGRQTRGAEPPLTELSPVLDALTPAIVPHLDKPFAVFGHGVGAIIAFELTRQLRRDHSVLPECLIVSARVAPHVPLSGPPIHGLPQKDFVEALRRLDGAPKDVLENAAALASIAPLLRADLAIHETYTYTPEPPLDCDLVVFGGLRDPGTSRESLDAWQQHTARTFVRRLFPGDHHFIVTAQAPFLRIFAQQLYPIADRARLQPKKRVVSLQSRVVSAEDKAAIQDWFYLPIWKQSESVSTTRRQDRVWLIFADEGGLGQAIAERTRAKGVEAVLVRPGTEYGKREDDSFVIRIGEQGDYSRLLKELRKSGRIPGRMVHLWTADREWGGSLEEKLDRSFYSLFYLAQAIGDQLTLDDIELCVISSDMQEVTGEEALSPEKATVRGPCKVIRQEYARVATRSLDISFGEAEAAYREPLVEQLTAELASGSRDQFVALRQGKRWTEQFESVRMEAPAEQSPRFRAGGVVLITGGVGGIGLAFAE